MTTLEHLKSELSTLPATQREELAQYLLDSLEAGGQGATAEWLALAKRRLADVRAERVRGIPAAEVLKNIVETRP